MKGISPRNDTRRGIANLWKREVGSISPRTFADSVRASEVRHIHLSDGATVKVLAKQLGIVHKMAIEPGSANTFYACSELGLVTHFDLRTNEPTNLFSSIIDSSGYVVELYAIAIDPTNPNLLAVAGTEKFAHIYDIRKWGGSDSTPSNSQVGRVSPTQISSSNADGITGLAYSNTGELLISYSRNDIYLFPREQVSGFNNSDRSELKVYEGHSNRKTVKGVYFLGPSCEYVTSGSDSGHAFIWRKRDGVILRALKGDRFVVNCIEPHPLVSVLATSGIDKDVKVWSPQSFECEHSKKEVEMAAETMDSYSSSDGEYSNLFLSLVNDEDGSSSSLYDENDNYDEDSDGHDHDHDHNDDDDDDDEDDDDDSGNDDDDGGAGAGTGKVGFYI
ncbi:uncharacterized protein LOC144557407 isoform X2 [Carex rostrata]